MCDKAVSENDGTLKFVPDCYKNQEICNKAVDNFALEFVPGFYMTQEMCNKIANTHYSTMKFVPECYKTQEMSYKAFNKCFLSFFHIPDRYKTQEMPNNYICEDPFFYCVAALKFFPG